jgi:endonuclease III-like uncharacterized protein
MTDNITLPRAHAKVLRKLLEAYENPDWWDGADYAALAVLDAALAEQKPQVEGYNTNRDQPTFTIKEVKP